MSLLLLIVNLFGYILLHSYSANMQRKEASLVAQLAKNLPAMQETPVWFLGGEDPLEKGSATHSNILGFPWCLSWLRIGLHCGRAGFDPWVGKIPWRMERLPTPVCRSEVKRSRLVLSDSLRPCGLQPTSLLCPWDFPGKSTGVGCHFSSMQRRE